MQHPPTRTDYSPSGVFLCLFILNQRSQNFCQRLLIVHGLFLQKCIALRGEIVLLLLDADIFKESGKRHTERSGDF